MDSRFKGHIAELKVELRAAEKGFILSRPTTLARYDAVLDDGKSLLRVQIKYAGTESTKSKGSVVVGLSRRGEAYTPDEVDGLLVYIPKFDKIVFLPPSRFCGKKNLCIRYEPTLNNQAARLLHLSDLLW